MTLEELTTLAKRCLEVVKNVDEDIEDYVSDDLTAGEPEYAIASMLDVAYSHPELYARFPDEVYELAKDSDYPVIHRYLDLLEKNRAR
ncbi:hypothetical protein D2E25_0253 [Bifidobacterium goeldii]|uniref:MafI family immunity protein n=1 Tax=Bifidobacterium goeldii TaxID=2306975 RepID=A0A430FM94_9BIFI|nr:hypothetical protein [Bifidobacterium goeldii]RSX53947.1 hypothetical protein D2E25_0253 [Bifidobacterium goeldii]